MNDPPPGWLAPHVEERYTDLWAFSGWFAQIVCYYAMPQQTLVVYLSNANTNTERMMILYNCKTIHVKDLWTVDRLDFKYSVNGQTICDSYNGIQLEFDGGQIVTREEGTRHVARLDSDGVT